MLVIKQLKARDKKNVHTMLYNVYVLILKIITV